MRTALVLLFCLLSTAGCRQPGAGAGAQTPLFGGNLPPWQSGGSSPWLAGAGQTNPQLPALDAAQMQQLAAEVQSLNARLNQFNSDNDNLHAQIAALQQRLGNANSYNDSLRQQLADTMGQMQQLQAQNQQLAANAQAASASSAAPWQNASTSQPGATIRANNGLMQRLNTVQLPGFRTWMDGDVIRIEGPTDRLFVSGSYQINANDSAVLQQLAQAIRQNFPQQVVSVEAHWDGSALQPATLSHHQLTTNHAHAVLDLLVRAGLPTDQVFTMSMGSNRPRYANSAAQGGVSPNRRIEIVIYPETWQ